jgi:hypothetical protein
MESETKPYKTKKTASFEAVFVPGAGIETNQFGIFKDFPKTLQKSTLIPIKSTLNNVYNFKNL